MVVPPDYAAGAKESIIADPDRVLITSAIGPGRASRRPALGNTSEVFTARVWP